MAKKVLFGLLFVVICVQHYQMFASGQSGILKWKKLELSKGQKSSMPLCPNVTQHAAQMTVEAHMPGCGPDTRGQLTEKETDFELYITPTDVGWTIGKLEYADLECVGFFPNRSWFAQGSELPVDNFPFEKTVVEKDKEYILSGSITEKLDWCEVKYGDISIKILGENLEGRPKEDYMRYDGFLYLSLPIDFVF